MTPTTTAPAAIRSAASPDRAIGPAAAAPALELRSLSIDARLPNGGWLRLVRSVDLQVARGELAVSVGESGSGNSVLLMGALGLPAPAAYRVTGQVRLNGADPA